MRTPFIFATLLTLSITSSAFAAVAPTPTLTDKIDQMIMVGFRGTTVAPTSDIAGLLKNTNIGGVILFDYDSPTKTYGRNIKTTPQIKALTTSLQSNAKTPLMIAIDEEGGQVSRLKKVPGFTPLPSASVLGTLPSESIFARNVSLASIIKSLGINVNFAPVLDLTSKNPLAPLTKQKRTFSSDPATVAAKATSVITAMNNSSIISAGKHFPGLGEAVIDTHKGLATVTTHDERALEPYKLLTQKNTLPMVMVGHIIDTTVDPLLPASLSRAHMNVLRKDVGFSGVIITDDLDMGAIRETNTTGQAVVKAVNAGADMVIISNNITLYNPAAFYEARNALVAAVANGTLTKERIDASYARITTLKKLYSIIR